jgi:hypothetical protein
MARREKGNSKVPKQKPPSQLNRLTLEASNAQHAASSRVRSLE